jgi:hypothetical protein
VSKSQPGPVADVGRAVRVWRWTIAKKKARRPMGQRAKFREETPVTRKNEEPNSILDLMMHRTIAFVQRKLRHFSGKMPGLDVGSLFRRLLMDNF